MSVVNTRLYVSNGDKGYDHVDVSHVDEGLVCKMNGYFVVHLL